MGLGGARFQDRAAQRHLAGEVAARLFTKRARMILYALVGTFAFARKGHNTTREYRVVAVISSCMWVCVHRGPRLVCVWRELHELRRMGDADIARRVSSMVEYYP